MHSGLLPRWSYHRGSDWSIRQQNNQTRSNCFVGCFSREEPRQSSAHVPVRICGELLLASVLATYMNGVYRNQHSMKSKLSCQRTRVTPFALRQGQHPCGCLSMSSLLTRGSSESTAVHHNGSHSRTLSRYY